MTRSWSAIVLIYVGLSALVGAPIGGSTAQAMVQNGPTKCLLSDVDHLRLQLHAAEDKLTATVATIGVSEVFLANTGGADPSIWLGGPFTMIPPSRITSKVKADVVHRILSALFSRAVKDGQDSS